jgi:hypothetical protein
MQKLIDEMRRTAENHRALTEPVPVPLTTLEDWINRIETAAGIAADIAYLRDRLGEMQSDSYGLGNAATEVEDTIDKLVNLLGDDAVAAIQMSMEGD